ncbi:MAG: RNA polymerase sigma factor [Oscillospiraceae bacterium]|nr:RNA polymerase sigma factor [Oscillospiraceae bacterium]
MQKSRVEQAFSDYADIVLRAAWHMTGRMQEAEDCTQEAFLRLLSAPDHMTDAHILPWLIRTAVNLAKDYRKSAEHTRTVSLESDQISLGYTEFTSREESVLSIIMSLPKEVRVPMCLHFVEGYSIDETAEMLHTPRATIASRIRRARIKIKALCTEHHFRKEDAAI